MGRCRRDGSLMRSEVSSWSKCDPCGLGVSFLSLSFTCELFLTTSRSQQLKTDFRNPHLFTANTRPADEASFVPRG